MLGVGVVEGWIVGVGMAVITMVMVSMFEFIFTFAFFFGLSSLLPFSFDSGDTRKEISGHLKDPFCVFCAGIASSCFLQSLQRTFRAKVVLTT